ncbi:hypothetical protein Tco_1272464 [Tanacetum coccineum]
MKDIFEQMEDEVDQCSVAKKSFEIEKKQLLINNDRLLEENIASDIMCTYLRSLNEVDNCGKCKSLDIVLLDLQESNKSLSELRKRFAKLEEYIITLDIAFQNHKEQMILNDPDTKNKQLLVKTINNQSVEINDLKVIQKIEDENVSLAFQVIPKVVEKIDLSKSVTSHLTTKKIIEKCIKVLAPVYVSASCPFTQSGNEKWAPATSHKRNNKPYVDASRMKQTIETITKEHAVKQNTRKTDNTMLPFTGRVSSTNASGSKPKSNTKNDRIPQLSSRSMKNKVEAHHRNFKSSANKNNHVSDCNANVKNIALSKNSDTICLSYNECLFFANHDACVVQYHTKMQKRKVAKSAKQKVKSEWKPTGRIFKTVGLKWIPTGRTFNLIVEINGLIQKMGNIFISRVYYVEGLGHNLFSVGSRGSNLYTISMADMMKSSPKPQRRNLVASTLAKPPTKNDWDLLFQLMFDEYFKNLSAASNPIRAVTLPPLDTTGASSSSFTSIDKDAPSPSTSPNIEATNSPINSTNVELNEEVAEFNSDTFTNPFAPPKTISAESSSRIVDTLNM